MADNLTTTTTVSSVPNGTVIATDDVGGAHYQRVKLVSGADGESGPSSGVLYAGTNALTTSAEALAASQAVTEVLVQADAANTTNVLIGNSGGQYIQLGAGGAIVIPVANLATVYVKMASGTGTVNYLGRS